MEAGISDKSNSCVALNNNRDVDNMLHIRIVVPDISFQTVMIFHADDTVWTAKQKLLKTAALKGLQDGLNYGLYCLPANGRAGKFLDEERPLKDYPLPGPVGVLEFKYKKRVYKTTPPDSLKMRKLHSQTNLKSFIDYVRKGDVGRISALTDKGLDPNFIDRVTGETPLTMAATLHRPRSLMLVLVSGGAILDYRNGRTLTAVHVAVQSGNRDALATLLDLGASPNYKDGNELTPLYHAVMQESQAGPQCVQMLLFNRSEIGAQDSRGNTELHLACMNGRVQHVEHLVFYGADMTAQNSTGDTPLHICARYNQEECARVLLFRGADKTIRNNSNRDAMQLAHLAGNGSLEEIIRSFRSEDIVLFQELPTYNEKRRGTISAATLRNLQRSRSNPQLNMLFDSTFGPVGGGSCSLSSAFQYHSNGFLAGAGHHNDSVRQTLRQDASQNSQNTHPKESDRVPRTVLVHKDQNGFGFILRGAKSRPGCPSVLDFSPTPDFPSLQYFDIVEKNSMAERAGLRCGDFLLEIGGVSVVNATHEHAVQLIKSAGELLVLKVIEGKTPDPRGSTPPVHNSTGSPAQSFKHGYGFSSSSASSSRAGTCSRSTLDGLEELEKLDATLDNYERDGIRINQQRSTITGKTLTSFSASEPALIANGPNATTYIAKVELHEVPVVVDGRFNNGSELGPTGISRNRLNEAGPSHGSWSVGEPLPDYDVEDRPQPALSLPRPQPILPPPIAPPLPASVITTLWQHDSPRNTLRGRLNPSPKVLVDEPAKQRDEAHAALMAAVMRRRRLLESVDGEVIADSIENRVQRSKMLQTVYRADSSTPEIRRSSSSGSSNPVGLYADGGSIAAPSSNDAAADFAAEAEKARLEFLRKAVPTTAQTTHLTSHTPGVNKAKQVPVKPARTHPAKSHAVNSSEHSHHREPVVSKQNHNTASNGPSKIESYNPNFVAFMNEDPTRTHASYTDNRNGSENSIILRTASDVGESLTEMAEGGAVNQLKVNTEDTFSVLSSLSTLSTNSSVGVDAVQSSHGSPSHSSSGDSGYAKSTMTSPLDAVDQPIIPPPMEFATDGYAPFTADSTVVAAAATSLRSVVKPQSNSMLFPARARISQK